MLLLSYIPEDHYPLMEDFFNHLDEVGCRYYASDLASRLGADDQEEVEFAIRKAITVCRLFHIPVHRHFKRIYRSKTGYLMYDWKLSAEACSLIIMTGQNTNTRWMEMQQQLMDF